VSALSNVFSEMTGLPDLKKDIVNVLSIENNKRIG
jgi:hypothetical protein